MKKIYAFLTFSLLCIIGLPSSCLYAQKVASNARQAEKQALKGDKYLKKENYYQAVEQYNQALVLDSNNVRALANSGVSMLLVSSNPESLKRLRKAYLIDPQFDPLLHYWLGRAYHLMLQPDLAVESYNRYLQTLASTDPLRDEAIRLITQARFSKLYMENPVEIVVQNLGSTLNSIYPDYSPILTSDEKTMFFTSRRIDGAKSPLTLQGDAYENIYTANQFFDGSWSKPKALGGQHKKKKQHVSSVQLLDNDHKLLVYNSSKFGSLFTAEMSKDGWSEPVALNKYTHTSDYEASGFVNPLDSTVYFASSKGSRDGDLDLFVSHKEEGNKWSEPQPLSNIINTNQDEEAPFISKDGLTLYFCSRGHDGMGGYDVYRARYNPGSRTWSRPINLGFPINSPGDDIYFVMNDSTGIGYVSSNRMGTTGGMDIFKVKPLEPVLVNGYVTDKKTQKPLPGFTVQLTSLVNKDLGGSSTTRADGLYNVKVRSKQRYRVDIIRRDSVVYTEELNVPLAETDNVKIIRDYEIEAPVMPAPAAAQRITIANLNLMRITYVEFDTLLINGVVKDHDQALANSQVQLREESSAEVKYSTTTDSEGNYHFAFVPGKQEDYVVDISRPGYQFTSVVVLYAPKEAPKSRPKARSKNTSVVNKDVNVIDLSTQLVLLEVGAKSVLGGVYFEFNSAVLKPESSIVLDHLYNFLNDNPTIRMEIGGFTDNVGSAYVNRIVAQKRAQTVVNYLVSKGMDKSRLASKGYGEDTPVADNVAELNGRDVNRRVEIKILSK